MQRAFLVSLLQELASLEGEDGPKLILGFEEPELYQHPPQAQHMAVVLEKLTDSDFGNQIILTTHSPYFIFSRGFESVGMVRKGSQGESIVSLATVESVEKKISDALGGKSISPSHFIATMHQIMQPSQRELFFCRNTILDEEIEDIAFIVMQLKLTKQWDRFRKLGCHLITCIGKSNISRMLAVCQGIRIPAFIVFDAE